VSCNRIGPERFPYINANTIAKCTVSTAPILTYPSLHFNKATPIMRHGPLPLTFEDRTAQTTNTDFDEMYDRLFFHVARQPGRATTKIYQMNSRASRHRSTLPIPNEALIHLDFATDESLGTVSFFKSPLSGSIPMSRYLKKTAFFGP
jgi:hypothetical protein